MENVVQLTSNPYPFEPATYGKPLEKERTVNNPTPEANLTYALAIPPGCAPLVATRVCALARIYRKLLVLGCNRELTEREERKKDSTARRATELLAPYGLHLDHPWGLNCYALPIGADGHSSSDAVQVAP